MEKYKYPGKNYLHFDNRIQYTPKVESYVEDFSENPVHSFLPFILTDMNVFKYHRIDEDSVVERNGKKVPLKLKERPIMYAAHMDSFIFKHFGIELNELYNNHVNLNKIDHAITAYRNNKRGRSNIHFAAEVINFISENPESYIYVGDYKNFFDTLDHVYLKEMINLLYVDGRMPSYQYKIYKNITKFAYIDKKDINEQVGSDKKLRKKKQYKYFLNAKEFRKFKKMDGILKTNENIYGIPQGTAISAFYSNIYLIEMDKELVGMIENTHGGMYRRYSDDFIIILPKINKDDFLTIVHFIEEKIITTTKINLNLSKTEKLYYDGNEIVEMDTKKQRSLDYLGFVFDGTSVRIRERSIYKYYRSIYKLIKRGKKISIQKGHVGDKARLTYKRKLYSKYHDFGRYIDEKYNDEPAKYGSFIDYARKANRVFDSISPLTANLMEKQVKNYKYKIAQKVAEAMKYLRSF